MNTNIDNRTRYKCTKQANSQVAHNMVIFLAAILLAWTAYF